MNSLPPIPCANMVEHDPPGCSAGRSFPSDCHSKCPKYEPGINQADRTLFREATTHE